MKIGHDLMFVNNGTKRIIPEQKADITPPANNSTNSSTQRPWWDKLLENLINCIIIAFMTGLATLLATWGDFGIMWKIVAVNAGLTLLAEMRKYWPLPKK